MPGMKVSLYIYIHTHTQKISDQILNSHSCLFEYLIWEHMYFNLSYYLAQHILKSKNNILWWILHF